MAKPPPTSADPLALKALLLLLALGLATYILGPSLYWQLAESIATAKRTSFSCSPCVCDCADNNSLHPLAECAKLDHLLQANHGRVDQLHQELKAQEAIDEERQLHFDNVYLEVKKLTSQYQKEAEKCNVGMETSEEAREKLEGVLALEMERTNLWERRARELGWLDVSQKNASEVEFEKLQSLKLVLGRKADASAEIKSRSGKSEE